MARGFYERYLQYRDFDFATFWEKVSDTYVGRALEKDRVGPLDFLALLSPAAERHLEAMARKAHRLTIQQFGRVMALYTPMYLANYCTNQCLYCGFSARNPFPRRKLTLEEVEEEARLIAGTGLRHILILTGESRKVTPVSYVRDCAGVLGRFFPSIGIEIYPLETVEYAELAGVGVDSLTIYQEVYDEEIYDRVHAGGPKRDYHFRLDAPERGCRAGFRAVNIGALLGLGPWRREAFFTGLHAEYLQDRFPDVEVSVSVPRLRPYGGNSEFFRTLTGVEDRSLVQIILALRLFLPRCGITLSTREAAPLRDNLVGLGITRMSAGSNTAVGSRIDGVKGAPQFEIQDERGVKEICDMLARKGYKPVFKDWHPLTGAEVFEIRRKAGWG